MPMQPSPTAETARLPSLRCSIGKPYHIRARERWIAGSSICHGAVGDFGAHHRSAHERRRAGGGPRARTARLTNGAARSTGAGHSGVRVATGATETGVACSVVSGAAAALAVGATGRAL